MDLSRKQWNKSTPLIAAMGTGGLLRVFGDQHDAVKYPLKRHSAKLQPIGLSWKMSLKHIVIELPKS